MRQSRVVLACSVLLAAATCLCPQDLPPVDVDAPMAQVSAAKAELKAEAERLVREEGAEAAISRLRREAQADKQVAFQRLNLAAVVAALVGDEATACDLLKAVPVAPDDQLVLALARYVLVVDVGGEQARKASADDLAWQGREGASFEAALQRFASILAVVQSLAPDSLDLATTLNNIGAVYSDRGDLDRALDYYQRDLAIGERLAPDSLDVATTLNSIGAVYYDRGDLDRALGYYQRSLAIAERLAPDSLDVATTLNNIAAVHCDRGDLDRAVDYYQRSLAMEERLAPDSLDVATTLSNIGRVYYDRGDLDRALEYLQRSLAIAERLGPDSLLVATTLNNIGAVCYDRGDLDRALDYFQRDLAIGERLAPDSLDVAPTLNNIGLVYYDRGDLDRALDYYERSLAITERLAPDSLHLAASLRDVGRVCENRGDLDRALDHYQRCLATAERLAPQSAVCAASHWRLGALYSTQRRFGDARAELEAAVAILEQARERSGVPGEARSRFAAQYGGMYHDLMRVLLHLGEVEGAADTAERMRARSFMETIATRSVSAGEIPAELVARQRTLDAQRNRLHDELGGGQGKLPDEARQAEIKAALAHVDLDQETLVREIRAADPRYAALEYPQPMKVAELFKALDPGTVVLAYVVDEDVTRLLVFGPEVSVEDHDIAVSARDLQRQVSDVVAAIAARQETKPLLTSLGTLLVKPAGRALSRAHRLLILPDGPLWGLPFQALILNGRPLCDRLPVHYSASGTVFVEARRFRKQETPGRGLVALADPDSSRLGKLIEGGELVPVRTAAFAAIQPGEGGRGLGFKPLPFSGLEAKTVGRLFADEAQVLLKDSATEANARQQAAGRRVVHFATHGLLDLASPLDSALVLAIPEERTPENDGFLKAWEVYGLDLKGCDLVTLSACETAKGETLSGEGVIGLTRAFLYAGAASVLSTQWMVADDSTAALMARFYTHYRAGDSKDVALQKAMREIRRGKAVTGGPLPLPTQLGPWRKEWAHPYYWAPFVLVGEYQQTGGSEPGHGG